MTAQLPLIDLIQKLYDFSKDFIDGSYPNLNSPVWRKKSCEHFDSYINHLIAYRQLCDGSVVCNETNNYPSRIDNNEAHINIFFKPNKSISLLEIETGYDGKQFFFNVFGHDPITVSKLSIVFSLNTTNSKSDSEIDYSKITAGISGG
jgi:hypothetical protein